MITTRVVCIDTMAKSLKLAWIPTPLAEEENSEDSWKAIPNYLLHKFGRLNFLLRCNYNKTFLATFLARINLPQFYKEILQHFLELLKDILQKFLFTPRIYLIQ